MEFSRTGVILNTGRYRQCVDFYRDTLGLPVIHEIGSEDQGLTTFALGDCYLMVEPGGTSHEGAKPVGVCPTKFRFNVSDVRAAADALRRKGVEIEVMHHDWGMTAEFSDPDGNRCALRSDEGFGC